MANSKKTAEAPLTEDQKQTFSEAEQAAKTPKKSPTKSGKQPKDVRKVGNGAVRKDW